MMIKRIALAALAGATMLAGASGANAANLSAPTGFTFNVAAACTLTGNIANLGTYTVQNTGDDYVARNGKINFNTGFTNGSENVRQFATVNCGTGVNYLLVNRGAGPGSSTTAIAPNGTEAFYTVPVAQVVDGAVVQSAAMIGNSGYSGTGNGAAQVVSVRWMYDENDSAPSSSVQLIQGTYTGTSTAVLIF